MIIKNCKDVFENKLDDIFLMDDCDDIDGCIVLNSFSAVVCSQFDNITQKSFFIKQLINCGVGQVVDISKDYLLSARAYKDSLLDYTICVMLSPEDDIDEQTISQTISNITNINPKAKVMLGFDDIFLFGDEQIVEVVKYSKNHDLAVYVNVSQTLESVGECDSTYGMSPIAYVESVGLLDRKCMVGGCVYCDKDDVALLKQYDAKVCVWPSRNLIMGEGVAPVYSMIKNNIDICIGIESICAPDIFREMFLLKNLQSGVMNMSGAIDDKSVLKCAQNNLSNYGDDVDKFFSTTQNYLVVDDTNIKKYCEDMQKIVDFVSREDVLVCVLNDTICYKNLKN